MATHSEAVPTSAETGRTRKPIEKIVVTYADKSVETLDTKEYGAISWTKNAIHQKAADVNAGSCVWIEPDGPWVC